jgi:hypothetical protein
VPTPLLSFAGTSLLPLSAALKETVSARAGLAATRHAANPKPTIEEDVIGFPPFFHQREAIEHTPGTSQLKRGGARARTQKTSELISIRDVL